VRQATAFPVEFQKTGFSGSQILSHELISNWIKGSFIRCKVDRDLSIKHDKNQRIL
jgi:hypothetical protein